MKKSIFGMLMLVLAIGAQSGVPASLAPCLKQCCDTYGGDFDQQSSYCDMDYQTSVSAGFSSCQQTCAMAAQGGSGSSNPYDPGSSSGNQPLAMASGCCAPSFILLAVLGLALRK